MGNIRLITGHAGEAHITAEDAGALHASLAGAGQYVFNKGNKLAATVTSGGVRLKDGDLMMQGRHARIEPGTTVDLAIANGTAGYYRHDLIVARYTKNASTGVESVALVVIKGTASSGAASDPTYQTGDIVGGNALQNDMPLYRVPLNGLTIQTPVRLFTVLDSLDDHAKNKNNPHNVTYEQVGAAAKDHTHSVANLGAAAANHKHTLENLSNVHVSTTTPTDLKDGHWYIVKNQ